MLPAFLWFVGEREIRARCRRGKKGGMPEHFATESRCEATTSAEFRTSDGSPITMSKSGHQAVTCPTRKLRQMWLDKCTKTWYDI